MPALPEVSKTLGILIATQASPNRCGDTGSRGSIRSRQMDADVAQTLGRVPSFIHKTFHNSI